MGLVLCARGWTRDRDLITLSIRSPVHTAIMASAQPHNQQGPQGQQQPPRRLMIRELKECQQKALNTYKALETLPKSTRNDTDLRQRVRERGEEAALGDVEAEVYEGLTTIREGGGKRAARLVSDILTDWAGCLGSFGRGQLALPLLIEAAEPREREH